MKTTAPAIAILALTASAAIADTSLAINIELDDALLSTVSYDCGSGGTMSVHYISSENDTLALVPVDDDDRIFVNVVAASGARYVAAQYEWWSKGQSGRLTDLIDDRVLLDCEARD